TKRWAVIVWGAGVSLGLGVPWNSIARAQAPGLLAGGPPTGTAPANPANNGPSLLDANPPLTLTHLNAAIERNPRNARAYNERGKVYARMGKLREALADYTKALEIEPTFTQALGNRGLAYRDAKQYQLAIDDFNRVLAARPELAKAYHDRGETYRQMGQL